MRPIFDDQTRALIQVGFFKPVDLVVFSSLAISSVTSFFWVLFGKPSWQQLALVLLSMILVCMCWLIILVYRCCYHSIMARSEINTMPEAAAKLAVSYQIGSRTPPQ